MNPGLNSITAEFWQTTLTRRSSHNPYTLRLYDLFRVLGILGFVRNPNSKHKFSRGKTELPHDTTFRGSSKKKQPRFGQVCSSRECSLPRRTSKSSNRNRMGMKVCLLLVFQNLTLPQSKLENLPPSACPRKRNQDETPSLII